MAIARCPQQGHQGPGHAHHAEHIDLEHGSPMLGVGVRDRVETQGEASVVEQEIAAAELGRERFDARRVGDIESVRFPAKWGYDFLYEIQASGTGHHVKASSCEIAGRGSANTSAAAGYDGRAAFRIAHGIVLR